MDRKKIADSSSKYYLGEIAKKHLPGSKNKEAIVEKLLDPQWNVKYIAAYLAMFCRRWNVEGFDISNRPEIIGTLYSLGPYHVYDGSERQPHRNPRPNYFGEETARFYFSSKMVGSFRN